MNTSHFPGVENFNSGGTFFLDDDLGNHRMREHSQVWAIHVGENISLKHGLALTIAHDQIEDRSSTIAFHHATVVTVEARNSHRTRPFHHGRSYWVRIWCGLNKNRASCSPVVWIWNAVP